MYDACIMKQMRRTTVTASPDALDTLQAEAVRRGVSLTVVIAEAIDEKALALRDSRRMRFGLGDSQGRSPGAAVIAVEPVAEPPY
jgi:hypothetical protein